MSRIFKKMLVVSCLWVAAASAHGMTSQCGLGFVLPVGKVTFFHSLTWSGYDIIVDESELEIHLNTDIVSPFTGSAHSWALNMPGGTFLHFVPDPADGLYEGGGFGVAYSSYGQDVVNCWTAAFLNNVPDPVFTSPLTFSPNPAVVGETVTANWAVQNATGGCTRNGSPINTQGPLTFTADMSHNTTFTILCAAAGQPSASDSEDLVVWECDANVNAPTGPNSPVISPVQTNDLLNGGTDGGQTYVGQQKNLDCYQVCQNHDTQWRIGGQVLTTTDSFSKYTTRVQYPNCSVLNRSAAHIANSQGHELIHSTAMVGAVNLNNQKIAIQSGYQSQAACYLALSALDFNMDTTLDLEFSEQKSHNDHQAMHYPKVALSCVAGQTVETDNGTY